MCFYPWVSVVADELESGLMLPVMRLRRDSLFGYLDLDHFRTFFGFLLNTMEKRNDDNDKKIKENK